MTAYLVRHAKAGDRTDWQGDDRLRPLSKPGRRQAEDLVGLLKEARVEAVLSSPYLRCIETVEPLARHFGIAVQREEDLAEGAGVDRLMGVIRRFAGRDTALCTHGDLVQELLEDLIRKGVVAPASARLEKGSTWVLTETEGRITGARYISPP